MKIEPQTFHLRQIESTRNVFNFQRYNIGTFPTKNAFTVDVPFALNKVMLRDSPHR